MWWVVWLVGGGGWFGEWARGGMIRRGVVEKLGEAAQGVSKEGEMV